jgi:hypothetical protein
MKNVANCENYCETHNIVNNEFLNAYCSEKACHLALITTVRKESMKWIFSFGWGEVDIKCNSFDNTCDLEFQTGRALTESYYFLLRG